MLARELGDAYKVHQKTPYSSTTMLVDAGAKSV
jgi:hypothetical protein